MNSKVNLKLVSKALRTRKSLVSEKKHNAVSKTYPEQGEPE